MSNTKVIILIVGWVFIISSIFIASIVTAEVWIGAVPEVGAKCNGFTLIKKQEVNITKTRKMTTYVWLTPRGGIWMSDGYDAVILCSKPIE